MAFRIDLLFVYISLCILSQYDINARSLEWPKKTQNLGFSWGNCGPETDTIRIISLSIGPDPVRLPGNVAITASVNITKAFPADVNAHVEMQKKIAGIWIKVPCEHGVGSCSYTVCTNKTEIYPRLFKDFNASKQCPPVPPAIYSVANLVVNVQKSLPSIAQGEFSINVNMDSNTGGHVGCIHLGMNLKS